MNTLMLVVVALVALCYCGGKYCPKVLSSNKEMLLGVLVGVALCSFMDLRLEGIEDGPILGGNVTTSETVRSHLMEAEDLPQCTGTMARLYTDGTINADQHMQGVQACSRQFADAHAAREQASGGR
jgi:hypothetical protein